ncbi:hypothetical protein [Hymenobacter cavernae]|uniref:Secreted protein n=1 Tax=Hymenobacter cavernae TaxID=2044852 RepID=A0ABQ1TSB9_9BACT|nr:hypothetical protein [Hymenobacter cavernae]GGF00384.1 hypothetical protein GCM10011383_09050 [Hymenobacter cavernae]
MRHLLLICGLLLVAFRSSAQDVILQTNGEEVKGKVLTITPEQITYLQEIGDTLRLANSAVFLIRYANGTKEVLHNPAAPLSAELINQHKMQGIADARRYYRAPGAFWGSFGATYLVGPFGAGAAIAIAQKPPKEANLNAPNPALLQDSSYAAGYRAQAHRQKKGAAWAGFGTSLGAQLVVTTIAFAVLLGAFR